MSLCKILVDMQGSEKRQKPKQTFRMVERNNAAVKLRFLMTRIPSGPRDFVFENAT